MWRLPIMDRFADGVRLFLIIGILLMLCIGANSQTVTPTTSPTEVVLAQALQKALNEVEAARALQIANERVIASQAAAIKSRDAVILMQALVTLGYSAF